MKLEVLISTMHRKDMSLLERMNIKSDALIINQYDYERKEEIIKENDTIRKMISLSDRGLSKSRNLAIHSSDADICVIADDDLVYTDNYPDIIKGAYSSYPNVDIIAFCVPSTNKDRPTSKLKNTNVGFFRSMKLSSYQLTFKRKSVTENNIEFNELFGAGSYYTCGEENIWLSECLKKGLKIRFENAEIATVNHGTSTWFEGFNPLYLKTKGAMFYAMRKCLWLLLISQYAIRKYKLYRKSLSFIHAMKLMFTGRSEYRNMLLKGDR